jgi:hypothetical protein
VLGEGLRPCRNLPCSARERLEQSARARRGSDPAETYRARRGSPTPPKPTVLGEGLRPCRNRRPKVSRDLGDLRSAGWLGQRPATAASYGHDDSSVRIGSRCEAQAGAKCSCSARVSDPAETYRARRGSPTPPKPTVLGEGLRPCRNRRPKVSRDLGDLRSAGWLGQRPATAASYGHDDSSVRIGSRCKAQAGAKCSCSARDSDPAETYRARRGSPTLPKPPTEGLPRSWRPSVGRVARSETGHSRLVWTRRFLG